MIHKEQDALSFLLCMNDGRKSKTTV